MGLTIEIVYSQFQLPGNITDIESFTDSAIVKILTAARNTLGETGRPLSLTNEQLTVVLGGHGIFCKCVSMAC